jgi:pentatricopeptide repeat protein
MMNVICRAIARLGSTDATGKVFEAYGALWGLTPDADSYNAVMESCEAAGKVAAVEGLLSYMASKGCPPNTTSWNLLLSTAVKAGVCESSGLDVCWQWLSIELGLLSLSAFHYKPHKALHLC